ncbi:GAP family protein [Kitasatospora sp. NPDC093806]|uniref:GAP family protein n=1 Tax=Kitasatospora sp. NPDC093806 TaxID=3155075 RepID=UPI00342E0BC5
MGDAVGRMLPSAVGLAISPLPLIATILLLATPRGRVNATAFAAGWAATLAAVVAAVLPVAAALPGDPSGSPSGSPAGPPLWACRLDLALGLLLLLLAAHQWRDRPREGHVHGPPAWMRTVDRATPARAAGLGVALAVTSPKNPVLAVGGAVSIATVDASPGARTGAAVLLVLIGSLCALLPLTAHLLTGPRAPRRLAEWKAWTATHHTAILLVLLTTLGTTYLATALPGLTR